MSFLRPVLSLLAALGVATASLVGAQAPASGGAGAPLTLRATCDASVDVPLLRVQIVNTGKTPAAVVLGFNAPKDQAHVVNSLDVIAIRQATGANDDYVYVNPKYALAKGAPWVVSIAPGASHALELPMRDFISTLTYNSLDPLIAGGTRVIFESRKASGQAATVWTGKIETTLEACRL